MTINSPVAVGLWGLNLAETERQILLILHHKCIAETDSREGGHESYGQPKRQKESKVWVWMIYMKVEISKMDEEISKAEKEAHAAKNGTEIHNTFLDGRAKRLIFVCSPPQVFFFISFFF